jgi:adenosylcobinamide-phosphate synthase
MGSAITFFEARFRKLTQNKVLAGFFFALFLIVSTWTSGYAVVKVAGYFGQIVQAAVEIILLFYCISSKSLKDAAMEVKKTLDIGDITRSREKLSFIVGRETEKLNETQVSRATIETVAENLVDGFISPVFFALIGGPPLALAYKMVNTLDSMVGYKNETYMEFGKASARIDDVINFIPSKLSVFIIAIASFICFRKWKSVIKGGLIEGHKHTSPNAGYPEAAFSAALEVKLVGPSRYHGTWVDKPFIGETYGDATARHIDKAVRLMMVSSAVSIPFSWVLILLVGLMFHL